jgi:N-methylhydantoinase A/acetophenone carboxylase
MDATIGRGLSRLLAQRGFQAREFALFAYGGAGPVHCCGYAEQAGISKIITFPLASVFSAYGASTMDVMHTYIRTKPLRLLDSAEGAYLSELAAFNSIVEELQKRALVDMRGEGFRPEEVHFSLDLVMVGEGDDKAWISSPRVLLQGPEDVKAICEAYRTGQGGSRGSDVLVQSFMLRAVASTPHWEAPFHTAQGQDPHAALKGEREVYWEAARGFVRTTVYQRHLLRPGNLVEGPALVEGEDTTCVIPPGWRLTVDGYLNGIIERAS